MRRAAIPRELARALAVAACDAGSRWSDGTWTDLVQSWGQLSRMDARSSIQRVQIDRYGEKHRDEPRGLAATEISRRDGAR
jgi:hypothetical protein